MDTSDDTTSNTDIMVHPTSVITISTSGSISMTVFNISATGNAVANFIHVKIIIAIIASIKLIAT